MLNKELLSHLTHSWTAHTDILPDTLRNYFRQDRLRLNLLFEAVNQTLSYLSYKHGKSSQWRLGFVLVCHTFGRSLNFNCHIHALVSEGMINKLGEFKPLKYFNFELLRKSFMKTLLDLLHKSLGTTFYKEKCALYESKEHGFYVHGPNTDINVNIRMDKSVQLRFLSLI